MKKDESRWQKELLKIQKENGGILSPLEVVDRARDKKSPLHNLFEWDDAKAAEMQRITHAQELIRRVRIEITTPDEKVVTIRKFVSLPSDRLPWKEKSGGYRHVEAVFSEDEKRVEYLESIKLDIQALTSKLKAVNLAMKKDVGEMSLLAITKNIDQEIYKTKAKIESSYIPEKKQKARA